MTGRKSLSEGIDPNRKQIDNLDDQTDNIVSQKNTIR